MAARDFVVTEKHHYRKGFIFNAAFIGSILRVLIDTPLETDE